MAQRDKRIMTRGLLAASVGVFISVLMSSNRISQADEFDVFDGSDFGTLVQRGLELIDSGR
ncbi:MAG: hypothetical protein A4E19_06335 [Nitrospira sp. SG-bin1]|nr:MAG: hypothetical protein A4E19_06335 [Nitrospira sp. SG-bin1]